jgi:hypothetical protein
MKMALASLVLLTAGMILNGQNTLELDNDTLHLKLDLTRGGAINYISKSGTSRNIVNIHDEGRYVQQSYYAGQPLNRLADGQSPDWSPWPWNPIQVGDAYNNRAEILASSKDGNTLYVKCIPMLWDMNNEPAEAIMEQWTTLEGNVLRVHNKLTCQRTDNIWEEGISRDQELPAVYPVSALKHLYSYFGALPFTGAPLDKPEVIHLEDGFWGRYENDMVTESWMAFVDDNQWGMGVYTPICSNFLAGMAGSPDYEASDGPTSYIAPVKKEILNKHSVFEYDYWLVVGTLHQIRSAIYAIKGVQANAWEFTDDLEGWHSEPHSETVTQSSGRLEFTVTGKDPYVNKQVTAWQAGDLHYLWLSIRNETPADSGAFSFFFETGDSASVAYRLSPNEPQYQDVLVDLDSTDFWKGANALNRFRLHPLSGDETGTVYVDFIRFLEDLIQVSSEGNVVEIKRIGNSLQLYAEEVPSMSAVPVDWSLDLPGLASVDANGLLTAVAEGIVTVTATVKDGSGKSGSIRIIITDTRKTAWEFNSDLEGWNKNLHGGTVSWSEGALRFTVTGPDPYVNKGVGSWQVGDLKYLWMRVKNETAGTGGAMYMFPAEGGHDFAPFSMIPNDSEYRDIYVDMKMAAVWNPDLVLNTLRLDPNNGGETGDIYVDFIRFLEELVAITTEGGATEIVGIGSTLQLYAEVMVSDRTVEVDWNVNDPAVATVDASGLLTSLSAGEVEVTAIAKDGSGFSGTIKIKVTLQPTYIDQSVPGRLEIYPNPAGRVLYIKNTSEIQSVDIVNMTGQVLKQVSNQGFYIPINVESLDPGFYLLQMITTDGHTKSCRFLKE